MKNILVLFIFLLTIVANNTLAQSRKAKKMAAVAITKNKAEDAFLKNFPTLSIGSKVAEQECKTALDARVPREAIANIDYKSMLYQGAKNTDKWDIMPIGKFKIKEGVYFLLYFSAYMGANHTIEFVNYVLNTSIIDFNQNKQVGTNQGNNAEFVIVSENHKQRLLTELGHDSKFTVKANFEFNITDQNNATMTSNWTYTKRDNVQKSYNFYWDNEGNLSIK